MYAAAARRQDGISLLSLDWTSSQGVTVALCSLAHGSDQSHGLAQRALHLGPARASMMGYESVLQADCVIMMNLVASSPRSDDATLCEHQC